MYIFFRNKSLQNSYFLKIFFINNKKIGLYFELYFLQTVSKKGFSRQTVFKNEMLAKFAKTFEYVSRADPGIFNCCILKTETKILL